VAGKATIEAYTVMHDRDGEPETAIAAVLLNDSRRAWATSSDLQVATAMSTDESVGRKVNLNPEGTLQF
jgi:acetyl-CoA C-acetyltransferase